MAPRSLLGADFYYRIPCLSLLRVAALTPPGWEVRVLDEKVERIDCEQDADLVGITAMTCSANRGYEIADPFRRRGIPVVMGGIHVSSLPRGSTLAIATAWSLARRNNSGRRWCDDAETGQLERIYRHTHGPPSLNSLPHTDWSLYRGKGYLPVHFVETTRGCPLDCEFCAVTTFFGGHYRNRPLEDVLAELHGLRPFDGFVMKNVVFFVDDNIVSNRAYAREFLTRIADLGSALGRPRLGEPGQTTRRCSSSANAADAWGC